MKLIDLNRNQAYYTKIIDKETTYLKYQYKQNWCLTVVRPHGIHETILSNHKRTIGQPSTQEEFDQAYKECLLINL